MRALYDARTLDSVASGRTAPLERPPGLMLPPIFFQVLPPAQTHVPGSIQASIRPWQHTNAFMSSTGEMLGVSTES